MSLLAKTSHIVYKYTVKPLLFTIDPEKVHDATLRAANISGRMRATRWLAQHAWHYQNPILRQTVDGISYENPIGLAAGWDKDATAIGLMEPIGFGFSEVGSITQHPYAGNEGTRLWRLPKSSSIAVYYGLKNQGVDMIAPRIAKTNSTIPVGTNIARTNSPHCDDAASIEDYAYSFKKLSHIGDYFTINVSCPNTFGGQPFHDKKRLDQLLSRLDTIKTKKPVYIKLSPDITFKERQAIAKLAFTHNVQGFICGNLTKNRTLRSIYDENIPDVGGLSGKVVEELSNTLISDMYTLTNGQKTIIGLGGVFSGEDAYQKITLGASLVQLITGLIYQGPQCVGDINKELAFTLKNNGYNNVQEAVGTAHNH